MSWGVRRRKALVPAPLQTAAAAAVANVLLALPAHAEAGKIFDFNLTLPVMVAEFLLLMVFLDKFWFTPVGKVLDERDAKIRSLLGDSKVRARCRRPRRARWPLPAPPWLC